MFIDGNEFNIIYIDPSISDDIVQDGLTPSTAYKNFPTLENNTCYVIRRIDNTSSKFYQGSSTVENIILLGMPKINEPFYDLLPEEVINLWGDDEGTYANLLFDRETINGGTNDTSDTNYQYCVLRSIKYLHAINCRFHRINSATLDRGAGYMFAINSNTYGVYKFNNCHFGCNYTIIDEDYAENNEDVPTTYHQKYVNYITFSAATVIAFDSCIIEGSGITYDAYYDQHCFTFRGNVDELFINNCTISHFGVFNRTDLPNLDFSLPLFRNNTGRILKAYINNNTFNRINRVTQRHFSCFFKLNFGDRGTLEFNNNKLQNLTFRNFYYTLNNANIISFYFIRCNGLSIKDFYADLSEEYSYTVYCCIFKIEKPRIGSPGIRERIIKNVTIKMRLWKLYGTNGYPTIAIDGEGVTSENFAVDSYNTNSNYPITLENINIITSGCALDLANCNLISGKITGHISVNTNSYINLDELTNPFPDKIRSININSNFCGIRVKKLVFDKTNALLPQITFKNQTTSGNNFATYCIIDDSPVNPLLQMVTNSTIGMDDCSIWCCNNYGGNRFYSKNNLIYSISSNIHRVGSADEISLKIKNGIVDTAGYMLELNPIPLKGFSLSALSGIRKFTCYFSTYNLNFLEVLKRFTIILDITDKSGNLIKQYNSKLGIITEDNSIWTDDNVNAYKLIINNIEIPQENEGTLDSYNINVRIKYAVYSSDGYMYIDPTFILE